MRAGCTADSAGSSLVRPMRTRYVRPFSSMRTRLPGLPPRSVLDEAGSPETAADPSAGGASALRLPLFLGCEGAAGVGCGSTAG